MRQCGRIHSATVVSMDQDKQVIVAEWYEKGETKGKELPRHTQVPLASAKSGTIQDRRSLARPALHQQNGHDRAMGPPPAPLPTTKSSTIISSSPRHTQVPLASAKSARSRTGVALLGQHCTSKTVMTAQGPHPHHSLRQNLVP
ncbi:hypothetical protein HPB50_004648 [Hyalomma asiaticum]|uniref:Uncharacterized protein n=1 Tax=Hyalomma asiaticum TaxID=266040 RepID=A0ACB7T184_HYAAI|nr:hypothetical protein HPB50_004648 [Hyalomma asiaticum]